MATHSSDRRQVLKLFGAIGVTCAYPFGAQELYGQTEHAHAANAASGRFLNEADFKTIARIADLIIPATDTPGAAEAGVAEYIDFVIARDNDYPALIADGLRWLDAQAKARFLDLDEGGQLAILEPLCEAADHGRAGRNVEFFALVKRLTADGYYTSRIGLMEEIGYKGNMARDGYPECVHEH